MPRHRNKPVTALELIKNDLRNAQSALDFTKRERDELREHLIRAERERDESRKEAMRLLDQVGAMRSLNDNRVAKYKRIISDLECDLADARGYIRAQSERIESLEPVVEIPQPSIKTTKSQLRTSALDTRDAAVNYLRNFGGRHGTDDDHWTKI